MVILRSYAASSLLRLILRLRAEGSDFGFRQLSRDGHVTGVGVDEG